MSTSNSTTTRVTLDELIALNDEMVALTRAGVPLDRGLLEFGSDLPGRLGKIAAEFGRRLNAGESLSGIVSQTDNRFPAVYCAVLEAGLRSGRLSAALEAVSASLRRVAQLRRLVTASLIYPIILLAIAYFLFVWTLSSVVPSILLSYSEFDIDVGWLIISLVRLCQSVPYWWPWPPIVAVVLLLVSWFRGRTASFSCGSLGRILPSLRRLLQVGQNGAFVELLLLLIEHNVPLDETIVLAANACGNRKLKQAAAEFAEQIQRGEDLRQSVPANFPPFLGWLIKTIKQQPVLLGALRQQAESYRAQAQRLNNRVAVYLPIFLAVGIGVTAVAVLAVSVLGPWYTALFELAKPHAGM